MRDIRETFGLALGRGCLDTIPQCRAAPTPLCLGWWGEPEQSVPVSESWIFRRGPASSPFACLVFGWEQS